MKKILSILWFVFLCSSELVSAQTTAYEEGFVVTKSGDTLYGQVKDRSAEPFGQLYKKIKLKVEGRWFPKTYRPSDLKAYQKGNAYFETLWIQEDFEWLKLTYISREGLGEEVFMKVIVQGKLTYYQWEWRDPDSGYYRYIPLFKKQGDSKMLRVTQGLFGLRRKALADYLGNETALAQRILSGEQLTELDIVELYNKKHF
jgi:hypothetical protein